MDTVNMLRDVEEIKTLRWRYCHLVDDHKFEEVMALFSDDCHVDFGVLGSFPDKEALGNFYQAVPAISNFTAHMMHNPVIEVKGEKADGMWYLTCHSTRTGTEQAILLLTRAYDEYVKKDGVWKIKSIRYDFKYVTSYEDGWGKTPFFGAPE